MRKGEKAAMGRIFVEIEVVNNRDFNMAAGGALPGDQVRRVKLQGLVDTGATYLVLPAATVQQLGLPMAQPMRVRYADGRQEKRDIAEEARVELLGRHGTFKAIVEPGRTDALIGAIVKEDLDLIVDCLSQTLLPRDPNQIIGEIG